MKQSLDRTAEIQLWLRQAGKSWFGIAESSDRIVATAIGATRDEASAILVHSLPPTARSHLAHGSSDFADATVAMLAAIESGDESAKIFELSREFLGATSLRVYSLVAAIPRGYASSYGRVAEAGDSIAREVGRLMANNPLYPIVPCHRVVGSDYSLVGYRGKTRGPDLDDKLERLRAEARGFSQEIRIKAERELLVFPVEWVIAKAEMDRGDEMSQLSLW